MCARIYAYCGFSTAVLEDGIVVNDADAQTQWCSRRSPKKKVNYLTEVNCVHYIRSYLVTGHERINKG